MKFTSTCSMTARRIFPPQPSMACATARLRLTRCRRPIASRDGAAAPLQEAGAVALRFPDSYYQQLASDYLQRRDRLLGILDDAGFKCFTPRGAYYIMTDISAFGFANDVEFARYLVKEIGVASVPGSSFYHHPADGAQQLRFTFCKKEATLAEASRRLSKLRRK